MNKEIYNRLKERLNNYNHTSMRYIEYDALSDFEIIEDKGFILLKGQHETGVKEYHFACQTLDEILPLLDKDAYLSFVPKAWIETLEANGFKQYAAYNDFFSTDFSHINTYDFIKTTEITQAVQVTKACYDQSRGFHGETEEWMHLWLQGKTDGLSEEQHSNVLVYRQDGQIVGIVCVALYAYDKGPTLWIREIAVDPSYQRKGIGRSLMASAMTYGKDRGARKAFLMADELNIHAIKLYNEFGFEAGQDQQLDMRRQDEDL